MYEQPQTTNKFHIMQPNTIMGNLGSRCRTTVLELNMVTFAFTSDIKWSHVIWDGSLECIWHEKHVHLLGSYVMPTKSVSVIYKVLCPACKHVPMFCSIVIHNMDGSYADCSGKYLWTQVVEYVCFIILQIDVRN